MTVIGILSDTHDILRPAVLDQLKGCDKILHAGDLTSESLLDTLGQLGDIYAVLGNNDRQLTGRLQKVLRFEIQGIRFEMAHEKRNIPGDLRDVDVVIFGHTHKYFQEKIGQRLWLNPGSCGRRRFSLELTMAKLYIENGKYYVQKIDIPAEL